MNQEVKDESSAIYNKRLAVSAKNLFGRQLFGSSSFT